MPSESALYSLSKRNPNDVLVRFPYETPIGVVCALIGAPYFLFATLRARNMA